MGDRNPDLSGRARRMSAVYAVMAALLLLILLQVFLLMVATESYLGTRRSVLLPAAGASGACALAALWMVGYLDARRVRS